MPLACDALTVPRGRLVAAEPLADFVADMIRSIDGDELLIDDDKSDLHGMIDADAVIDRLTLLLDHLKGGPLPL